MAEAMASMDITGHGRSSLDNQGYPKNYGQVMGQGRALPPRGQSRAFSEGGQGYGAPMNSRAPPPRGQFQGHQETGQGGQRGHGYGDYDDTAGPRRGPPANGFGPPARSQTTQFDEGRANTSHQRAETLPYNGPAGRVVPQRPATTTGTRPAPQRTYPQEQNLSPNAPYGSGHDANLNNTSAVSLSDVFDDYYDSRHSNPRQGTNGTHDIGTATDNTGRNSYDQPAAPRQEQPHRGPHHTPQLSHAKSMAEMREPQSAVFEMAGDIPSMPPPPSQKGYDQKYDQNYNHGYGQGYEQSYEQSYEQGYDQSYNHGYGQAISYDEVPPRGPSAPPAPGRGPYGNSRPANGAPPMPAMPQRTSPDSSLPSHPTPVRPGQMANSLVNPNGKPPPMRNYGGAAQPQQKTPYPQDAAPQQERQYAPPPVPTSASLDRAQDKEPDTPVTTQELEQLRMIIRANPADQHSALRLAKRLIEAADALIPQLPDPRARSKARERYLMDAHKILKKLASNQNVEAMFTLADGLGKGLFGGDPDTKEAFTLYQSAAKLGHPAAAYRTAVCCEIGHEEGGGTRRDPQKAIQWYKRSATLGDPPAMYKMGMVTLKGLLGQNKSPREAVGWLKRAAERANAENPHALHELGLLYESAQPNDYIIRDEGYALSLFQQAAELGYKFSQFRLGCAYEYGLLGCPIDARLSIVWYSRAAMQEEHQSELALSGWYLTGSEGVLNQSDTEAYLWARKAATAGMAKAEFAMGYFTEVGIGIPPNLEDAKRWYWRAAGT